MGALIESIPMMPTDPLAMLLEFLDTMIFWWFGAGSLCLGIALIKRWQEPELNWDWSLVAGLSLLGAGTLAFAILVALFLYSLP